MSFFWTVVALVVALALAWRYLGAYMAAVFEGRVQFLAWAERPFYRLLKTDPDREQTWQRYAGSLVVFSGVFIAFGYLLLRIQGSLPLNPQHLGAVGPALSFNTAVSFVTNTNWQNYAGETTMSYFSQIGVLTVQQFVSAAVGIAVAVTMARGFSRRRADTIGNFWVDITRCMLYVLLPVAFLAGVLVVGQGAVQTLAGPVTVHDPLNGVTQTVALGPAGFMGPIMQLGTNGGGFFNVDLIHPLENPTGLTNLLYVFLALAIPFSLTYTFGRMVKSLRAGAALLAVMVIVFGVWVGLTAYAEHQANPAVARGGVASQPAGNMEGKEVRFGDTSSALFNVAMTQTSDGAVDSATDSYNPMGGFGPLTGMMLGEVTPGGVGSGLYTILLMAIIAVFIGGLMIGRTPEYLGKKIQAREVKLAGFGILVMPITVLVLTGIAVSLHAGRAAPLNAGPHGFSEILYGYTSPGNNNGSAMAGLTGDNAFYNVTQAVAMLLGRFAIIVPSLALAGALAAKNVVPASLGTFRTDNTMFVGLLIGVIVIVGGLTFFPAVSLGPIVEQLSHGTFF
ncbi:MAG: potassium-transporting ATPase subunit KdpA [Acidimicrobiales bacterium]